MTRSANRSWMSLLRIKCCWLFAIFFWAGTLVYAWSALAIHAYTPAKIPNDAATTLRIEPSDSFRVVAFAHPFCPCTRATLDELAESVGRFPRQTLVDIVFVSAGLNVSDIDQSPLVSFAKKIPGVNVRFDEAGADSRRYGATISGEVFAFNPAGKLVYHGGITPARGHQGDAAGQAQLEQIVRGESQDNCIAPVYGCHLPEK